MEILYFIIFITIFVVGGIVSTFYVLKYFKEIRRGGRNLEGLRSMAAIADTVAVFGLISLFFYIIYNEISFLNLLIALFISILSGQATLYLLKIFEKIREK